MIRSSFSHTTFCLFALTKFTHSICNLVKTNVTKHHKDIGFPEDIVCCGNKGNEYNERVKGEKRDSFLLFPHHTVPRL